MQRCSWKQGIFSDNKRTVYFSVDGSISLHSGKAKRLMKKAWCFGAVCGATSNFPWLPITLWPLRLYFWISESFRDDIRSATVVPSISCDREIRDLCLRNESIKRRRQRFANYNGVNLRRFLVLLYVSFRRFMWHNGITFITRAQNQVELTKDCNFLAWEYKGKQKIALKLRAGLLRDIIKSSCYFRRVARNFLKLESRVLHDTHSVPWNFSRTLYAGQGQTWI